MTTKTGEMRYEDCRDRVIQIANHRMQMTQPTPMDVYKVKEGYDEKDEENVDAVRQGIKCYNCQGCGRRVRDP